MLDSQNNQNKNTANANMGAPTHPVLRALQHTKRGVLQISLPNGAQLICAGPEQGPQANMQVNDFAALDRIVDYGDIGLGEGYILGLWDTRDLKSLMRLFAQNYDVLEPQAHAAAFYKFLFMIKNKFRLNSRKGSRRNIQMHYDLGNDFYSLWLDDSFTYSCGLFGGDEDKSLEDAQRDKYQRILDHLAPAPTDHILEIGCGWGGFMEHAAKQGFDVTGLTISTEQAKFAEDRLKAAGLDQRAHVRLQDYREVSEQYDRIASIGMMEHVGEKYWPIYLAKIVNTLKPGGKAMIQTIVIHDDMFDNYRKGSDFIREHIFPGGMLPSPKRLRAEIQKTKLKVNDIFHFGGDYAITLEKWLARFDSQRDAVQALGYNDDFIRTWRFYLTSCAAMFRAGKLDVLQVELVKQE